MPPAPRQKVIEELHRGILDLIGGGDLRPGDQIPTEAALKARLGGSRATIREALRLLEQDGIIRSVHGRGRYLTAAGSLHMDRPITAFESIRDMAGNLGYSLETVILSVAEIPPPEDAAAELGLPPGQTVIRLERLRLHDRLPVVYSIDLIRRDLIGDRIFDVDWSGSLLDRLDAYGVRPRMSRAHVRATMLPEEVMARHDLRDFGPALAISETCLTIDGLPVLVAQCYHRGSHFSFSLLRK